MEPQPIDRSFTSAATAEGNLVRAVVAASAERDVATGIHCFGGDVLTSTFSLPWDLDPRVVPLEHTLKGREQRRLEILDITMQGLLEEARVLPHSWRVPANWQWLHQLPSGEWKWESFPEGSSGIMDAAYYSAESQVQVKLGTELVIADMAQGTITDTVGDVYQLDRQHFSVLVALKTGVKDLTSVYNAVSLALWCVHDRSHILQTAVQATLNDPQAAAAIQARFFSELKRVNPSLPVTQQVWETAKQSVKECPHLQLFVLANVIKRPIIVYSDNDERAAGGIYLPLMWEDMTGSFPSDSAPMLKNPVVLGYSGTIDYFCALVTFQPDSSIRDPTMAGRLPLVNESGDMLPIRYLPESQLADPSLLLSQCMALDAVVVDTDIGSAYKSDNLFFASDVPDGDSPVSGDVLCSRLYLEPLPAEIEIIRAKRTREPLFYR